MQRVTLARRTSQTRKPWRVATPRGFCVRVAAVARAHPDRPPSNGNGAGPRVAVHAPSMASEGRGRMTDYRTAPKSKPRRIYGWPYPDPPRRRPADAPEPRLVVLVNGRAATVEEADEALKSGGRPLRIACWEEDP